MNNSAESTNEANGRAELVAQDAERYQKILDRLERLEAVEAIRFGIAATEEGRVRHAGRLAGWLGQESQPVY